MGDLGRDAKRSAPAAQRNMVPIGDVLAEWLPQRGTVLETNSGTGEHARAYAERFTELIWQPSDIDPAALASIAAWRDGGPDNLLRPLEIDTSKADWPIAKADVVLSINMAHIAPWEATLGLLNGAARILSEEGKLIFYGPWFADDVETSPSNTAFDESLKARDASWGLRRIEAVVEEAEARGLRFVERRAMPANNFMLLFRKGD